MKSERRKSSFPHKESTSSRFVAGTMVSLMAFSPMVGAQASAKEGKNTREQKTPNVLIFLLDDVGFAHLGSFGGLIQTPNIDRVAKKGLRYTNFHTAALCSPSRAALLTGHNHHAVGTGVIVELQTDFPGYTGRIPEDKTLFTESLKAAGFQTAAFGKWHNTPVDESGPKGPYDLWPQGLGFDYFYGFIGGETSQWEPTIFEGNVPVSPHVGKDNYHFTADMTDKALNWLEKNDEAGDKPFFLYYATGAAHAPHHAPQEYIDKYKGKFDQGWDVARESILARQKMMGVVPQNTELSPRTESIQAWDRLPDAEKKLYSRMQEVYAGMIEHTDAEFGRILNYLEKKGELDNTIILITSDNGASGEGGMNGSVNETFLFNGLTEELSKTMEAYDLLGTYKTFNHYPAGWALAGNTPFKYFKQTSHEGGVRDPLIVSWPDQIADQGGIRPQFTHIVDIAATIYDLTGVTPLKTVKGVEQKPMDGVSFAPSLADAKVKTSKKVQYFEMLGNRGIWADGWKAVTFHGRLPWDTAAVSNLNFDADVWELYHIEEDFSESKNLAAKYPDRLEAMKKMWTEEATRNNVFPLDDSTSSRVQATLQAFTKGISNFAYTANDFRIPEGLSPPIKNRSYSIVAQVEIPETGADGMLVTTGGRFAGYAFFVQNGYLHYVSNYLGEHIFQVKSRDKLVPGRSELRFDFTKTGLNKGRGEIFINNKPTGTVAIDQIVPGVFSTTETFDVGQDTGSPVSDMYQVPFAFKGKLESLNVKLLD